MIEQTRCAMCKRTAVSPAIVGYALYCHDEMTSSPTCYERAISMTAKRQPAEKTVTIIVPSNELLVRVPRGVATDIKKYGVTQLNDYSFDLLEDAVLLAFDEENGEGS